jgi:hypothetical protein
MSSTELAAILVLSCDAPDTITTPNVETGDKAPPGESNRPNLPIMSLLAVAPLPAADTHVNQQHEVEKPPQRVNARMTCFRFKILVAILAARPALGDP